MNNIRRKPVPASQSTEASDPLMPSSTFPANGDPEDPPPPPPKDPKQRAIPADQINRQRLELWFEAKKQIEDSQPWEDYAQVIGTMTYDPRKTIGDNVMSSLNDVKAGYQDKQWTYTRKNGKKIVFTDVVDDILACIKSVKDFGAAAASCDPTKAAGVAWAGIQLIVTAAMNNKAIRDLVLDDQGSIAQIIECCAVMEQNYLQGPATASDSVQELRKALIELYSKILQYHVKAYSYMKDPKIVSGVVALVPNEIRSVYKAMNDIKKMFDRVKEWQQNVHGVFLRGTTTAVLHQHDNITAMQASFGKLETRIEKLLQQVDKKLVESQPSEVDNALLEILGSEEAIEVTYPSQEDAHKIPPKPAWLRLLFLYRKTFPSDSSYVEDVLQRGFDKPGSKVRNLDTLDVWRIVSTEVSDRRWSSNSSIHVNNMLFSVAETDSTSKTLSIQLTDQDSRHLTAKIPSLSLAKLILRNGEVSPGGGSCGETYHSTRRFETVTFPYAVCFIKIEEEHQVYTSEQFVWGRKMQASLIVVVKAMWADYTGLTKGGYSMRTSVIEFCDHLQGKMQAVVILGDFDLQQWYKLVQEAKLYFQKNSDAFEIGDVWKVLDLISRTHMTGRNAEYHNLSSVMLEAEAHFGPKAPWLVLANLLNISWNWNRAAFLPSAFQALLSGEACLV